MQTLSSSVAIVFVFFFPVVSTRNVTSSGLGILKLTVEKCPQILGCRCVDESIERVQCYSADDSKLEELRNVYGAGVRHLELYTWHSESLNFDVFLQFPRLETLIVEGGEIENLNGTKKHPSIRTLSMTNAEISSDSGVCHVINLLPNVQNVTLRRNFMEKFECDTESTTKLQVLDLSDNLISQIAIPESVKVLNLSENRIESLQNVSTELTDLDISHNRIAAWLSPEDSKFPNLVHLRAAELQFATGFELEAPNLKSIDIDDSALRFLDFHRIRTPRLETFSARRLKELRNVAGTLPSSVSDVAITETMVRTLPADFFPSQKPGSLATPGRLALDFSSNQLLCQPCLLQWALPVYSQSMVGKTCNLTRPDIASAKCTLGVVANETGIQYGKYEKPMALTCYAYGTPSPRITWYRFRPSQKLGTYDPTDDSIDYSNVSAASRESYSLESGGALLIHSPNKSHVERYVCVVENKHGKEYGIYRFRLDYLDWYGYDVFHSVFWGGLATSLIVCLISFLLNITWILTRKSALWWIQRAERLSRVRKMVEAMEKYRVRQMESLHQKYTNRVQIVRDNYHQQVEALRVSYAAQQEKFQNYRAAQVDAVHSHLDAMRDGYNNQLGRVREYGSKRAEQLWESYERQVNRMRTFSLQHRLKMMRQYKVKQRYVNKLLESFQATSPEVQLENEEKVRAALEIPDDIGTIDGSLDTPSRLSRSSSFHSLPEYVIDEQGNVRPGIIPTTSAGIRFPTTKPTTTSSPSSSGAGTSSSSK